MRVEEAWVVGEVDRMRATMVPGVKPEHHVIFEPRTSQGGSTQ
jgi:hypothetical protein